MQGELTFIQEKREIADERFAWVSIRTTDSARLPFLLRLPSELLLDILDLALPVEQNRRTTPERNETLRSLALVHPCLTAWAQTRLYRESAIYTDRAVEKLMVLTATPKGRGGDLAKTIVNLSIYGPLSSPITLARLVQQLPHLENLQLNDLDGLEMRAFLLLPSESISSMSKRVHFADSSELSPHSRLENIRSLSEWFQIKIQARLASSSFPSHLIFDHQLYCTRRRFLWVHSASSPHPHTSRHLLTTSIPSRNSRTL